jgi:glycolate oxidase FAD binding subunit
LPSVFEPTTVAQASEAFAQAAREGRRVSIARDGGDLVLATAGLDRILEHEADDLTVTVEAGLRLSELNARLGEHGQRLSLDPPGDPTIGGVIAGDFFGPLVHRFGRPRDLLLGVTAVFPDGLVASSGGKVVKNVAGYDLGKLLCGSRGRLALVARASFRLHPLPADARTLVVDVHKPQDAQRLYRSLVHSELLPSACDFLWPGRMAILFEGSERAVAEQIDRAATVLGGRQANVRVWAEARWRQSESPARRAFGAGELGNRLGEAGECVVHTGPTCFLFGDGAPLRWPALAERLRRHLDPGNVLV